MGKSATTERAFGAVAALEPGIEPVLRWEDVRPKHRFWRADSVLEQAYGKPVDAAYWAANNPASMVVADADRIRRSGLQIYLEAGDLDAAEAGFCGELKTLISLQALDPVYVDFSLPGRHFAQLHGGQPVRLGHDGERTLEEKIDPPAEAQTG